jgi:large subunit ribosomal protein L10
LALSRTEKERIVKEYGERLARAQVLIWSRYQRVKFPEFQSLRANLRNADAEAVVVTNTLFGRALKEAGLPVTDEFANGPNMVTFVYGDIASASKAMMDFTRDKADRVQVIGGVVGGQVIDTAGVQALTELPSREVLLARVVGGIQAPISGLVGTLGAMLRGLVNVLDAHRKQLEGAG